MPNTRVPASRVIPLSAQEAAASGFTHLVWVHHEDLDLTTANTAQTLALIDVADGDVCLACAVRLRTAFKDSADAALNTTTLIVGDSGSTARFLASTELNENGTEVLAKAGTGTGYAYTSTTTIDAIFGSMAAKSLSSLDTGKVAIFLKIAKLDKLAKAAIPTA